VYRGGSGTDISKREGSLPLWKVVRKERPKPRSKVQNIGVRLSAKERSSKGRYIRRDPFDKTNEKME